MQVASLPFHPKTASLAPERLAHNSTLSETQKLAEASRQFEAILLRQILAASQKTVIPSKLADNSTAAGIYRDMITNQLADSMSQSGGFGLARTFEHQLTRPAAQISEAGAAAGSSAAPARRESAPAQRPPHHSQPVASVPTVRQAKPAPHS